MEGRNCDALNIFRIYLFSGEVSAVLNHYATSGYSFLLRIFLRPEDSLVNEYIHLFSASSLVEP